MHSQPSNNATGEMPEFLSLMPLAGDGVFEDADGNGVLDSPVIVTPTHIAVGGDWNDPASWANNEVPGAGAIVHIPSGVEINGSGNLSGGAHVFMVRIDGTLNVVAPEGTDTSLKVDTVFSTHNGTLTIDADADTDGTVDIAISPFDIEGHKANGAPGWSADAIEHYRDGDAVTGWDGIADIEDGAGVLGRYSWDATQLSLGIVSHGKADLRGQSKTEQIDHIGLAEGATQMVVEGYSFDELNWSVGDRLLITGTKYNGFLKGEATGLITSDLSEIGKKKALETLITQDEVVRIKSIEEENGNIVIQFGDPATFDENNPSASEAYALQHSHIPRQFTLEGNDTNFLAIGNLSRNVTIRSDAATDSANSEIQDPNSIENNLAPDHVHFGRVGISGRLTDGTHDVTDRGHIMFMHNDDVHVESISVRAMGRTDKTAALDSLDNPNGKLELKNTSLNKKTGEIEGGLLYNDVPGDSGSAPADEIANHVGRYGLHLHNLGVNEENASLGAWVEGSVVEGSPGWGYAHHNSMGVLANNIAYDVVGSGFMAETGNEVGVWHNNLAVGVVGFSTSGDVFQQSFSNDLGRTGSGYWLEGRAIAMFENNAVSSKSGYVWHNEGTNQINTPTFALSLYDDYFDWVNESLGLTGEDRLSVRDGETLLDENGNPVLDDVFGTEMSKIGAYLNGADDVMQNGLMPIRYFQGNDASVARTAFGISTQHGHADRKMNDVWSIIEDSDFVEVRNGVRLNYTSKYIFDNVDILAAETGRKVAFNFSGAVRDNSIVDSTAEGFGDYDVLLQAVTGAGTNTGRSYHIDALGNSTARLAKQEQWDGLWTEGDEPSPLYNLYNATVHNLVMSNAPDMAFYMFAPKQKKIAADFLAGLIGLPEYYGSIGKGARTDGIRVVSETDVDQSQTDVSIELIEQSDDLGLVALWREQYKTDAHYRSEFALKDDAGVVVAHEAPLNSFDGNEFWQSKRDQFATRNKHTDIWSGVLLELDKTDSVGTTRFSYEFDTENGQRREYVTTNERLIFTPEQINATLVQDGYVTIDGITYVSESGATESVKFVFLDMGFTDRISGQITVQPFMVALDEAWGADGSIDWSEISSVELEELPLGVVYSENYSHYLRGELQSTFDATETYIPVEQLKIPDGKVDGTSSDDFFNPNYSDAQGESVSDSGDLIYGYDGNDTISGQKGNDTIYGGTGNDLIYGNKQSNLLFGEAGNDTIHTGNHGSVADGGSGNDHIIARMIKGGGHTLTGGSGADVFEFFYASSNRVDDAVITDFNVQEDTLIIYGETINLIDLPAGYTGTQTADGLNISFGDNDYILLQGVDITPDGKVDGTSSDDFFNPNYSDAQGESVSDSGDLIYGYDGNDTISGQKGNDTIYGGTGNDLIYGNKQSNLLFGEAGNDTIHTGDHGSVADGGSGNDHIMARMSKGGGHTLTGGSGADVFEFFYASSNKVDDAVITDFNVQEDTLIIYGETINLTDLPAGYTGTQTADGLNISFGDNDYILLQGVDMELL